MIFVGRNYKLARRYVVGAICQNGDVRTLFDVERFHLVEIDVIRDIRVRDDDVFLVVVHKITAKIEQRFDFALVHFVFAVESKRREKRKTAVFSVQVPISTHAEMVHKRVVVVASDDAYRGDVGMHEI